MCVDEFFFYYKNRKYLLFPCLEFAIFSLFRFDKLKLPKNRFFFMIDKNHGEFKNERIFAFYFNLYTNL